MALFKYTMAKPLSDESSKASARSVLQLLVKSIINQNRNFTSSAQVKRISDKEKFQPGINQCRFVQSKLFALRRRTFKPYQMRIIKNVSFEPRLRKAFFIAGILIVLCSNYLFAQNVGIGTNAPHASAQLDISNNAKGVLIPRMTTTAVNTIPGPAKGLLVYDSITNQLMVNKGHAITPDWQAIGNGNSGNSGNGWSLTGNSGIDPATNFIGNTDNKPLLFRVNNNPAGKVDGDTRVTFLGYDAGNPAISNRNTAIGFNALHSTTTGQSNTAVGVFSLYANTSGSFNSAIGDYSLETNTTGSYNSAVGYDALHSNTTGTNNTAVGFRSLHSNTTGSGNVAVGFSALDYNTTGYSNAAFGNAALYRNTTGYSNIAIGNSALFNNSTGLANSAVGFQALVSNTEGSFNAAYGHLSLGNNTTGLNNSAFGAYALRSNSTGIQNTVVGNTAMYNNTIGNDNAALGIEVLFANTTGSKNSAAGWRAMYANTTGYYNAAYGDGSLYSNSTGVGNTAVGSGALYATSTSSYNTTLGYHAGFSNNLGWNNTLIGAECNVNASGIYNSIALGNGVSITASNQARVGNFSTSSIGGYQDWTHFSDGRFKKNIKEEVRGLDFIMQLRPVTYQLDVFNLGEKLKEGTDKIQDENMQTAMREKERLIQTGFIAQEVEQAANGLGYDFSGVDKPKSENDFYGLRYAAFVVPLVKAVQEQQHLINEMKRVTDVLQKERESQKSLIEELLRRISSLESRLPAANVLTN